MRARRTLLVVLATLGLVAGLTPTAQADTTTDAYIVVLKKSVSAKAVTPSLLGRNAQALTHANAAIAQLTAAQAASLASNPNVKAVHKNIKIKVSGQQTVPPWDLDVLDSSTGARDQTFTYPNAGTGVTVYVMDSGLTAGHAEFAAAHVLPGVNYVQRNDSWSSCGAGKPWDPTVDPADTGDQAGHGTAVSSLIVGARDGVAKDAFIVPVRVLDCDGVGNSIDFWRAADWIIANHGAGEPAVVNLSLGVQGDALNEPAQALIDAGITVVAAAGNDNTDACTESPAAVPGVVTAAAVTPALAEPVWSDGQSTNYGSCVDLYAPGDQVVTAYYRGGSATAAGTSFSAPLVSGAAALVLGDHPTWTPAQVAADLTDRATSGVVTSSDGSAPRSPNKLLSVIPDAFTGPAPTISAPVRVTAVVKAETHWVPAPLTAVYQWYADGVAIPGAIGEKYLVTADDLGKSLTVEVTGSYPLLDDITDTSAPVVVGDAPQAGMVVPLPPTRIVDTRINQGWTGSVGNGDTMLIQVAGVDGVTPDPAAVLINITTTDAGASGYITGHASGTPAPLVSSANFSVGGTAASLAMVPVGADGKIALTVGIRPGSRLNVIVDLQGFVVGGTATEAGAVVPVAPTRLVDTRQSSAVGPDQTLVVPVVDANGVPADASAVLVNVTVTAPGNGGYLTVYPSGETRPTASNLNFSRGQTVPNLAVAKVGADGTISIFNRSPSATQVIVDIQGYVMAGTATASGSVVATSPTRVLDTRTGLGAPVGAVPAGKERVITFTGDGLGTASGVFLNLTVTEAKAPGWLSAYPTTGKRPLVSNLNFPAGATIPNLAAIAVNESRVSVYNGSALSGSVQMVADVFAYIL